MSPVKIRRSSALLTLVALGALWSLAAHAAAPEGPTEEEIALAQAEELGIHVEIGPETVVLEATEKVVWLLRSSSDFRSSVLERLEPGDRREFERGQQMTLFSHILSFGAECKPGKCPTPKPIPLRGASGGPAQAPGSGVEPAPGAGIHCFCDDLTTRQSGHPCYPYCNGKTIEIGTASPLEPVN